MALKRDTCCSNRSRQVLINVWAVDQRPSVNSCTARQVHGQSALHGVVPPFSSDPHPPVFRVPFVGHKKAPGVGALI